MMGGDRQTIQELREAKAKRFQEQYENLVTPPAPDPNENTAIAIGKGSAFGAKKGWVSFVDSVTLGRAPGYHAAATKFRNDAMDSNDLVTLTGITAGNMSGKLVHVIVVVETAGGGMQAVARATATPTGFIGTSLSSPSITVPTAAFFADMSFHHGQAAYYAYQVGDSEMFVDHASNSVISGTFAIDISAVTSKRIADAVLEPVSAESAISSRLVPRALASEIGEGSAASHGLAHKAYLQDVGAMARSRELWIRAILDVRGSGVTEGAQHVATGRIVTARSGAPTTLSNIETQPNPALWVFGRAPTCCAMPRAANELLNEVGESGIIVITRGGFVRQGGALVYRAPCRNCEDTVNRNWFLRFSEPPPGIPSDVLPGQEFRFQDGRWIPLE